MESFIEVENIQKSFKGKSVLNNISFKLNKGDIFGIIGNSGCGKSTFLKILVGYYKADKGKIFFNKEEVKNIKKVVGFTTQENSFYEKLSVFENMSYYSNLYGLKKNRKQEINSILDSVGLLSAKSKLAGDISGGMKRRLDFALSLIHDPELIILDEPTTGLDPILINQFWNIVQKVVKEKNKTVIVTSHILSEIEDNCNKVGFMDNGVIEKVIDMKKGKTHLIDFFKKTK